MTIIRMFPTQMIANQFAERFYKFWENKEDLKIRKVGGIMYVDNNRPNDTDTYMFLSERLKHMTLGLHGKIEYYNQNGDKLREEDI